MKHISTLLSVLALLAVSVLFYLHFSHSEQVKKQISSAKATGDSINFRVAYFDIDSLQRNYNSFKDAEDRLKSKEDVVKKELSSLNNRNQSRLRQLQEKAQGGGMSQAEADAAQRELAQLQQEFQQKELEHDQSLKMLQMQLMSELQKDVEDFLKKFNQNKGYAYIFSYRPGEFIYYKDTVLDITTDMIKGLNTEYEAKKKVKK